MADQTNAEVSDERLREIEGWAKLVSTFPQAEGHPPPERYADIAAVCTELITRRSVTSQASEGEEEIVGWMHPTARWLAKDREAVAVHCWNDGPQPIPVYASPSKRVERLETGDNHKLDTDAQVFFYEQDFYVLSNFSAFNLTLYGVKFPTSEHAYHWQKFAGEPNSGSLCQQISFAPSAHEAFKIAERNKEKRRADWDDVKVSIMRDILRAKAAQHEYVHRKLLATGDRELVEDSWRDDYWGWGPNRDGQNMLGKLWMEVRAELRQALQGGRS